MTISHEITKSDFLKEILYSQIIRRLEQKFVQTTTETFFWISHITHQSLDDLTIEYEAKYQIHTNYESMYVLRTSQYDALTLGVLGLISTMA